MGWEEERELVRRAKAGDGDAFATLWRCSERKVAGVCFGITSNRDDVEEVLAEAMCKSYQGLENFKEKSRFSTWLCQIASNICKNKVSRRREYPDSDAGADLTSNTTDIGDKVSDTEVVRWAVAQLSDEFREALVLRDVGGFSYKEIAIQQGVSIQTVKSRIHRARKALKKLLEEAGYGRSESEEDTAPEDTDTGDDSAKDDSDNGDKGDNSDSDDDTDKRDNDDDGDAAGAPEPAPVN